MYLDLLILARLDHGPAHGYEIKRHVARLLGGTVELNNNVLYPALRRFQQAGVIERVEPDVTEAVPAGRVARQVYRMTEAGQQRLQTLLDDASEAVVSDGAEFKARLAFFDRIEPVIRRQLLVGRRRVLESSLATMESFRAGSPERPWALRVLDFEIDRTRYELAWLDELEADPDTLPVAPSAAGRRTTSR